jgi:hypothetical protein
MTSNDGKWFEYSEPYLTLAMTEDKQRCYEGGHNLNYVNR